MFGQVVVGPPGAGKTTYCEGMRQFLESVGRKVVVINLDPANDTLPYPVAVDVRDLISLEGAARACELGPNGALVYCIEYLAANLDWLLDRLAPHADAYALFDMPGQVELYSHHGAVRTILHGLQQQQHRVCAVHLVDAHHCADPAKFISVLLVTLSAMVQLEVPQVNLLSKIDLIESYGELAFNLDFYTDLPEPARLLPYLEEREGGGAFARKHVALSAAICELVRAHTPRRARPLNGGPCTRLGRDPATPRGAGRRLLAGALRHAGHLVARERRACAPLDRQGQRLRLRRAGRRRRRRVRLRGGRIGVGRRAGRIGPGAVHERARPLRAAAGPWRRRATRGAASRRV